MVVFMRTGIIHCVLHTEQRHKEWLKDGWSYLCWAPALIHENRTGLVITYHCHNIDTLFSVHVGNAKLARFPSQGAPFFFFSSISSAFSTKWIIFISYLVKSGSSHRLSGFQSSGYSFSTLSKWSLQSTSGMREVGRTWRILFLFLLIGGIVL